MTEKKLMYNDPLLIPGLEAAIKILNQRLQKIDEEKDKLTCVSAQLFDERNKLEDRLYSCQKENERVAANNETSVKANPHSNP